jgi:aldose 1-epimerase
MEISSSIFGTFEGTPVEMYLLDNGNMQVRILNYGAIIQSVTLRMFDGVREVVLSYPDFDGYVNDQWYIGAVVGRVANRVDNASFSINGQAISLTMNEPGLNNHIHGGFGGFNRKIFRTNQVYTGPDQLLVSMQYDSPDGEEGYPGKVRTTVNYTLTNNNELRVEFLATSDADTHVNLTQHSYFNLNGNESAYSEHLLKLNAQTFLESDDRFLPTGKMLSVEDTRFDFTKRRRIFEGDTSSALPLFNTWYPLRNGDEAAVILESDDELVKMNLFTSYPGVLLYSGDYLHEPFQKCGAICLECQYPPDAPNRAQFPSTLLRAGEQYNHFISYQFEWKQ